MHSSAPIPNFCFLEKVQLIKMGIFNWHIPTHLDPKELFKLYETVRQNNHIEVIVEIGSYLGASSIFMAKGLTTKGKIYCVDTWKNDAMTEGKWDTFSSFLANTNFVSDKIVPLRGRSCEVALNFDKKIDLLFIDSDHSYFGVKSDFDSWFHKLKTGGLLFMHDVGWAHGVKRVLEEDIKHNVVKYDNLPNLFWGWKK